MAFSLKVFYSMPSSPSFWLANCVSIAAVVIAFKFKFTFRPINRLGQLSYSIYLIHFAVIAGVEWCWVRAGGDTHGLIAFFTCLTVALMLCWWLGVLLERTLERTSSRLGHRLAEAVPGQSTGFASDRARAAPFRATDSGT
jgi:peptidoglycan/LPS O-acetylase OafA/YrhL